MISAFGIDHGDISKAGSLRSAYGSGRLIHHTKHLAGTLRHFSNKELSAMGHGEVTGAEVRQGLKGYRGQPGRHIRDQALSESGGATSQRKVAYHVGLHRNKYLGGAAAAGTAGGGTVAYKQGLRRKS